MRQGEVLIINSCDDVGVIVLEFTDLPSDDRTATHDLGVSWRIVSGQPPFGLVDRREFHAMPPLPGVTLGWGDGAEDGQEPFDFEVVVVVRDRAGNESASCPIRITHRGVEASE